ncbi:MAG: hypothetical protein A2383_00485 [Candidatus Pacebacteria bacterium RIFOXYB1_FULL_39_46]|nr:MAG: hypothetical protein A2182_00315 [Candidatus Pacebacteria bacterium RIFOXYA1_FULL_38_18]OGJ38065.1 MAG: hypothetical protein A2383_00485 [Candidatus Pacebacteria bacterium RIFOXYB1_FULL_39_46]OGJ39712.1 MAG: hypothetical protein A2411_02960 [Candidatus Pacebacteria bacterium RIFOXYC1_FULL_39_21]OGJ39817.1 MAG: hypothetical protein A2582_00250 [Candidatus Pacebacteria bacterium RIFOXYD1_FULL_39_27]
MKKIIKIGSALSTLSVFTLATASPAFAQLTNPVVEGALGNDAEGAASGVTFANYFVTLWSAIIGIGAITVLVFFILGAFEWITSEGEKGKLEKARNRIMQAIIGLIILVGSFVILSFISDLFFGESFNILKITIPSALN